MQIVISKGIPDEEYSSAVSTIERAAFDPGEFRFTLIKREVEVARAHYEFRLAVVVLRSGGWEITYDLDAHWTARLEVDLKAGLFGAS